MKTKQKEKSISHIAKVQERYRDNQAHVQELMGWDDIEYYFREFGIGIDFIERLYPRDSEYEKFRLYHTRHPEFWQFWHMVFKNWEAQIIPLLAMAQWPSTRHQIWERRMNELICNGHVEVAFQENYQKRMKAAEL